MKEFESLGRLKRLDHETRSVITFLFDRGGGDGFPIVYIDTNFSYHNR